MKTKDVVQRFYDGLARKDSSWQDNLAEGVAFSDASGKLTAQGREAFIQSFSGFLRAVEKVQLRQLIVEGPNAAAVVSYDYVNPAGGRLHQDDAEVWKVENGQIVSLTIYFDITSSGVSWAAEARRRVHVRGCVTKRPWQHVHGCATRL